MGRHQQQHKQTMSQPADLLVTDVEGDQNLPGTAQPSQNPSTTDPVVPPTMGDDIGVTPGDKNAGGHPSAEPEVAVAIPVSNEKKEEPNDVTNKDCVGSYTGSFGPYFQMMKNPPAHLGKGVKGLFACWPFHGDEATNLLAFGAWSAIKLWLVLLQIFIRLIIVGIVYGLIGHAILWLIIGLLIGFLVSHTMWWGITRMDGCFCGDIGFVIIGTLCLLAALLNIISVLSNIGWWSLHAAIVVVDLVELCQAVPSVYMGLILVHGFLVRRKNSVVMPGQTVVVVSDNGNAQTVVVAPANGSAAENKEN